MFYYYRFIEILGIIFILLSLWRMCDCSACYKLHFYDSDISNLKFYMYVI